MDSIIKVAYDIGLLKMVMKRPKYYVNMKDIFYSDIIKKIILIDFGYFGKREKEKNILIIYKKKKKKIERVRRIYIF